MGGEWITARTAHAFQSFLNDVWVLFENAKRNVHKTAVFSTNINAFLASAFREMDGYFIWRSPDMHL